MEVELREIQEKSNYGVFSEILSRHGKSQNWPYEEDVKYKMGGEEPKGKLRQGEVKACARKVG